MRHFGGLKLYYCLLGITLIFLLSMSLALTQDESTPEAPNGLPYSLFIEDTCAPPCWFGLVAGESRIEDVVSLEEPTPEDDILTGGATEGMFNNEFDPRTNLLLNG